MRKPGRNEPCWCGSGKKYKRCHLLQDSQPHPRAGNEVATGKAIIDDREHRFDYDICLSFAGEDRGFVAQVADHLALHSVRVFYDAYERAHLWGKDLYQHLDTIYQRAARYCVVFISQHYASKLWTNHELRAAQARAFIENEEYILPARFDDTELPGIRATLGYIDLRSVGPIEFAHLILEKLGPLKRYDFFPDDPDQLIAFLKPETKEQSEAYHRAAHECMTNLRMMTPEERTVVFHIFRHGCPTELPDNMHVELSELQRSTGLSRPKLRQILSDLGSFGFYSELRGGQRHNSRHLGTAELVVTRWSPRRLDLPNFASEVVAGMLTVGTCGLSTEDALAAMHRLDFSRLGSAAHPHGLEVNRTDNDA
jgi:TIR domain-containing protein/SEC-C motif-containing protein